MRRRIRFGVAVVENDRRKSRVRMKEGKREDKWEVGNMQGRGDGIDSPMANSKHFG